MFSNLLDAETYAKEHLADKKENAAWDGWPCEMNGSIGYGAVTHQLKELVIAERKDYTQDEWEEEYNSDFDRMLDYKFERS